MYRDPMQMELDWVAVGPVRSRPAGEDVGASAAAVEPVHAGSIVQTSAGAWVASGTERAPVVNVDAASDPEGDEPAAMGNTGRTLMERLTPVPVLAWEDVRGPGDVLLGWRDMEVRLSVGDSTLRLMVQAGVFEIARDGDGRVGIVSRLGDDKAKLLWTWVARTTFDSDEVVHLYSRLYRALGVGHAPGAIAAIHAFQLGEGAIVNAYELNGAAGGGWADCKDYIQSWRQARGEFIPLRSRTGGAAVAASENMDDVLGRLAFTKVPAGTAGDPKLRRDLHGLTNFDCRALMALRNEGLFRIVALYLLVRLAEDIHPQTIQNTIQYANRLDHVLDGVDVTDPRAMTERLSEYVLDQTILAADSPQVRAMSVYQLYTVQEAVAEWIDLLPKAERAYFSHFQVAMPHRGSRFIKLLKELDKERDAESYGRRRMRADRLTSGFDLIRFAVDVRYNQIRRMHQAFGEAVAALEAMTLAQREAALPYEFHYREQVPALDGEPACDQHVLLRVTTRGRLLADMAEIAGDPRNAVRGRLPGGSEHVPGDDAEYLLEWVDTIPVVPTAHAKPLWLVRVVRSCFFHNPSNLGPLDARARREMLKELGLGPSAAQRATAFLGWGPRHLTADVYRAWLHLGRTILPIDNLFMACAFGRISVRITTTNGARPSEVLQLQADADRWGHLFDRTNRVDVTYFEAVPKMRDDWAVFFVDEDTRLAIDELIAFLSWRYHDGGQLPVIAPASCIRGKRLHGKPLPPARYIMAWREALDHSEFTICQRLVMQGLGDFEYYDLRHAFATVARAEHMPRDVLMKVMHHSTPVETDHYSDPTASEQVGFFTTFSGRRHLVADLHAASGGVLEDDEAEALGEIGALTRTPGGQCMNADVCSDNTACPGCSLNRSDPALREEVRRMEAQVVRMLADSEAAGFQRFADQQRRTLDGIRAMLREMDLLETSRADRDEIIAVQQGFPAWRMGA